MRYTLKEAVKYMSIQMTTEDSKYIGKIDIEKFVQEIAPKIKKAS